ncbi:sulfotransferase ssu-1-like [Ixodes scapularis]|uniref:sulfotransferase ssu-1-like n=1 Tax=Ixodes scapularis TaxID=6945 RepID=UPI001A9D8999|nr:sulfotransferase ssu-1-like [Ixodes scapularis]
MSARRYPVTQDIDGVKYATAYRAEHIREALSYMPEDGDIVLVSHAKCGNNWLQQIIQLILHRGQSAKNLAEFGRRTPFLELLGTGPVKRMLPPRFMKTHFLYWEQPMNPKAKYVYLTRNPLDVCTSFYHYTKSMPVYKFEDGTFDDFFELFVTGENVRGDFFDHLKSWYDHKDDANVLLITYEELKKNFRGTLLMLARFLGEEYAQQLDDHNRLCQMVVEKCSAPFMSKLMDMTDDNIGFSEKNEDNPYLKAVKRFVCDDSGMVRYTNHVRKADVGDWKSHFKPQHLERLRLRIQEKEVATILKALWSSQDLGSII